TLRGPFKAPSRDYHLLTLVALLGLSALVLSVLGEEILEGLFNLKLADKLNGSDNRYEQLLVWIEYLWDRPLLGNGLTCVEVEIYSQKGDLLVFRPGPLKNPFGYELAYARLLVEIGIVPFLFYAGLIFGLCRELWRTT